MPSLLKPTSKLITAYYAGLKALEAQQVGHEQAVRSAFQTLLTDAARPHKWTLIPELGAKFGGKRIIPDATLRDAYHLRRGYYEAKDLADNLDREIKAKIDNGYPLDNTIFWTPQRAVLYQAEQLALDLDIRTPTSLCDILNAFLTFTPKPLVDFGEAVAEFSQRVPELGTGLAKLIAESHKSNKRFQAAFDSFFDLCKTALNPNISRAAVDEMLVQHLLTERLFKSVFKRPEFLQRNVIAVEVDRVIDALTSRSFSRDEYLRGLDRFYVAIETAAERETEFSDKQHFLNTVYERFFQGYCVKTADTHGIVYTPQPIVDFMTASVEHVLKTEFGKKLGDDGVILLDPCTGTGNFVVNLMRRCATRGNKHLHRMFSEQLFANEIMLLPYYIAALNIEHEYFEHSGEYQAFEGLCFVDTLDLAEAKTIGLFSEANLARVDRQRRTPITVIIGNPPYNANQRDETDNNKNRKYPVIDARIRTSYARLSDAELKNKLYDPYVRFIRWAVDRLGDRDGIVCLVTNNSFVVDHHPFDGVRRQLVKDFSVIYHVDLNGNVRQNPALSGTTHNVFGIQTGVGITVAYRIKGRPKGRVLYARVTEELHRYDKLRWLNDKVHIGSLRWRPLRLGTDGSWLPAREGAKFAQFVPLEAPRGSRLGAVFSRCGPGAKSNRDPIVYGMSLRETAKRCEEFIDQYSAELDRFRRKWRGKPDLAGFYAESSLDWSSTLKLHLERGREGEFDKSLLRECIYRPFTRSYLYFDGLLNDRPGISRTAFPTEATEQENRCIYCTGHSQIPFVAQITNKIPNEAIGGRAGTAFPMFLYDENGSHRRENVTDWALHVFREHYGNRKITKVDIFYYVYAILHHPGYREKYAENLKRELPRIPFAPDFPVFSRAGKKLAELHLNYDDEKMISPYNLKEEWDQPKRRDYRVEKMRLSKDKSTLTYNDHLTLKGIPGDCFNYRLGNRSALEWVIDQYQVYTDPKSGITSDPNAWCDEHDDEGYIVRLVKQVITVSLKTNKLVRSLPEQFEDGKAGPSSSTRDGKDEAPKKPRLAKGNFQLRSEASLKQRRLGD